jgi:hypothetical protein
MSNRRPQLTEFDSRDGRSRQPNIENVGIALQDAVDTVRAFNQAARDFEANIPLQLLAVSMILNNNVGPLSALNTNSSSVEGRIDALERRLVVFSPPDNSSFNTSERHGDQS